MAAMLLLVVMVAAVAMLLVAVAMLAAERTETATVVKMLRTVADTAQNDDEANAALAAMVNMLRAA